MNRLDLDTQTTVISALVEGSSIRSVERMTGVHRDTITRLMVRVGDVYGAFNDDVMRGLSCERIEVDEIWCYVGKKQRHVTDSDDPAEVGDFWTWIALDAETKAVPSYRVGKRDAATAHAFMLDLSSRLTNRVQISSDALGLYVDAVEAGFGGEVDYATIVKSFEVEPIGPGRYSPPKVTSTKKTVVVGNTEKRLISTSYVERQNLTVRMNMRRCTRLTNGFSKKAENLRAAVDLHFAYYNLCRKHLALGTTPAVAAGVATRPIALRELVGLAEW